MAKYIQLYLDTDFILPIGVGESGDFQKYIDQQASRRLWLYFNKAANGMYESNEANKANFEAGRDGFYGDFWNNLEKGNKVIGTSYDYIELLDLSRIITKIRDWSEVTLFTKSPEFVLNFSTVIPLKARRTFIDYIESKLGKVRSYSIEMNDLLSSKIMHDYRSLAPSFGDQLLIVQSAGRDILLSVQTWCGDMFMQGDDCQKLKKKGNEHLKYALAKIVVDYFERQYNLLTPEKKDKEYSYQMQFAEKWLKKRNNTDNFWIDDFYYSSYPSKICSPFEVDGKQLDLIEREAIRATIDQINLFYSENIKNRHLHTILIGDVFKEEVFLRACIEETSSDGKYTYFNDNATQEALGRYHSRYSTLEEDTKDLERKYNDKSNERERIRTYVRNAELLGSLLAELKESISSLKNATESATNRSSDLKKSWEAFMRRSDFKQAEEKVDEISKASTQSVGLEKYKESVRKVERQNSLLEEVHELKEVAKTVSDIRSCENELNELIAHAEGLERLPKELQEKTQKYKDCYGRYQETRRKFEKEPTLTIRRTLIKEMEELTMEELPVIDISPIHGSIVVKAENTGGFLGFGSRKIISLRLNIHEPLPCKGVLVISPKPISSIPPGRTGVYCIDVEKGEEGEVINITEESTALNLGKAPNSLFVKFWPHENEKVPINLFEIKGGTITI